MPGLFVAGDVPATSTKQVVSAAEEGASTAMLIPECLRGIELEAGNVRVIPYARREGNHLDWEQQHTVNLHKQPTGLTKDVGFQIGVRRTMPITYEDAWELLTSLEGLCIWLGPTKQLDVVEGASYELPDGSHGEVRVYAPNSHLRISRNPPGWRRPSTIQIRVSSKSDRTVIAFH